MTLINTLGPVFVLILIGLALGRNHWPGGEFWPRTERFIYRLLFPALLIHALATAQFADVPVVALMIATVVPTLIVAGGLWWARGLVAGGDHARFTSAFQGAIRFNAFVSIAGATALHGVSGTAASAVVLAALIPCVNVLSVSCLLADGATDWRRMLYSLATNPLIVACVVGGLLNVAGIGLPGWSENVLAMLGQAALPLGLLAVGAAMKPATLWQTGRAFWAASAIKLVVLPALALGVAHLCGLGATGRDVVLLFSANATATSSYILARQLGGDADLMARLIAGQTLLAMLTLPIWLTIG